VKITVKTVYGELPATMLFIIQANLRAFARKEWKRRKVGLGVWERLTGKGRFVDQYVRHYTDTEMHPKSHKNLQ